MATATKSKVEIFTTKEFEEQALPVNKATGVPLWKYIGLQGGEHTYVVTLPKHNIGIEVRSSVHNDGKSAATGQDSIRCWLVDINDGKPMGSKVSRWTTRLPGWGERTKEVIRQLWQMGLKMVPCPSCKAPAGTDTRLRCFKVKKEGPNKGRLFLRCPVDGCKHFEWLDVAEDGEVTTKQEKPAEPTNSRHGEVQGDPCPDCGGVVKLWESRKDGKNKGKWFYSCNGKSSNNGEKGCGFFQWSEDTENPDAEPVVAPPKRETETFAVEIPAGMQAKLEELLKQINGRVCF
jgi:hypothetical protein